MPACHCPTISRAGSAPPALPGPIKPPPPPGDRAQTGPDLRSCQSHRPSHVPRVQTCCHVSGDRVGWGCPSLRTWVGSPRVTPIFTPLSLPPPRCRGARGPRGPPKRSHPLGVLTGPGNAAESVVDPDMEALFEDFLGKVTMVASAASRPPAQPYHYVLRDTEQKGLCLRDGHLVATSLQGANAAQEEPISVVPNRHLERRRCPLIVGIRGGTRALSCGTGPEPRLHLEDVELLELFSKMGDEATPFTFYKTFGGSTHTFEAAAFPGLFLSTAPGPGEALAMAPPHGATAFYLRRK
ncbi:interleukin-1 receptor antagonist protein-like isoform X2 [Pseudopipra pipra]|uniref:interleukin-1 receptor antagonist protein-like isoform X2 n=1 Tax=Pseudopipra pipra TaxID=415032 RepID=UPI003139E7F4